MKELDDILQHHGVKGMKWGVRKVKKGSGQNGSKKATVKETAKSVGRELSWIKKSRLKNMDKLSTKEIRTMSSRLKMENRLKELSSIKSGGTRKDRVNYVKRSSMSNQEISRKISRLSAKAEFKKQSATALSSYKTAGKHIVKLAAPAAAGYLAAMSPQLMKKAKSVNTQTGRKVVAEVLKYMTR